MAARTLVAGALALFLAACGAQGPAEPSAPLADVDLANLARAFQGGAEPAAAPANTLYDLAGLADLAAMPSGLFTVAAPGPLWAVSGRVTRGGDGVPGVALHLVDASTPRQVGTAVSGPDGAFAFPAVPRGDYLLYPQFPGQTVLPGELAVSVGEGPVEGLAFTVPSLVWFVDGAAPALTRDGLAWATALEHPQLAVDLAAAGDVVLVAAGSYAPRSATDRSVPLLRLKEGVAVYGGFAGFEADGPAGRNRAAERTVLDGQGLVDHVVLGASRARLDGFTVTGGRALLDNGGGLSAVGVEGMVVAGCAFVDNDATGTGGAVHVVYSRDLLFTACLFTGNIAAWGGAAAAGSCGEGVRFVNCTFARNAGVEGAGAALVDDATTTFANCLVWDNWPWDGAPIVRSGADPALNLPFTSIDSDPFFANADSRDFRLLPRSPCVDAGSLDALAGSLDAGKTPVPLDGDGDGVALPDLGAFELDPEAR